MFKKIILFTAIIISVSSCTTYNGFSERKYYDFNRKSSAIVRFSENNNNKEDVILSPVIDDVKNTSDPLLSTKNIENTATSKELVKSPIVKRKQAKEKTQSSTIIFDKNPTRFIVENAKNNQALSTGTEHRPGRFWWLWAIDIFIGLILALFLSAYVGIVLMIIGAVFTTICLIKYIKSK